MFYWLFIQFKKLRFYEMCIFVAHTTYINHISYIIHMGYVFRYFMNYLKSFVLEFKDNYLTLKIILLTFFSENIITFFKKHWLFFSQYIKMDHLRHQKYKNKQLKNSSLELENNFKPINISTNNMDKFEKIKELTKNRTLAKNTWFDWYC